MKEVKHQQYLQRQAARDARDASNKAIEDANRGEAYSEVSWAWSAKSGSLGAGAGMTAWPPPAYMLSPCPVVR